MTNGEKIQTILNVDRDCIEVHGENGTMTFTVTQDWWNAEYQEPTTKNDLGVDCISRQSVLNKIQRLINAEQNNIDENGDYMNYARERVNAYEAIQFFVENDCLCPSVTPQEPRWIPVSERLPEDYETVIASVDDGFVYPEARYSKEDGWEWAYESGADYWTEIKCDVVAWMPLPEPYKAETEIEDGQNTIED